MLEVVGEGMTMGFSIIVSSARYPLSVSCDMKSQDLTAVLIVGGQEVSLNTDGFMGITDAKVQIVLVLSGFTGLPKEFVLGQNHPNPFNPSTTVSYRLPVKNRVTLKVYDVLGREVATLVDEIQDAGFKSVQWDATDIATGVYFYRIKAGKFAGVKKMMLVR
jgi:hypothetical protein